MKTCLKVIILFCLLTVSSAGVEAAGFPRLFGTIDYRSDSLDALPQWQRVMREIEEEQSYYQDCVDALNPCEPRALLAWQAMIKGQEGSSARDQVRAVNRFVNQWQARSDRVNHGQDDYWASPLTFLRLSGDCEDYAIIKYVSLRQIGFDADQLRVVVVRDVLRDLAHAVLAVQVEDDVLILDNLFQAVLPQHRVSQYLPYYSVNENARFAHLPPDNQLLASSPWTVTPSAESSVDLF